MDRTKFAILRSLLWALPLAGFTTWLWSMGYLAAWDRFDPFLKAHTFRNLSNVAEVISAEMQSEVYRSMAEMKSIAERTLLPLYARNQKNIKALWFESTPDLVDISLWTASAQPQAGIGSVARRVMGFNSRNRSIERSQIASVLVAGRVEQELVPAVLMGREIVASQPLANGKTVIWMATPVVVPQLGLRMAVVAHWELGRFQTAVRRLGDSRIAGDGTPRVWLADAAGVLVAAPDLARVEQRETLAADPIWRDGLQVTKTASSIGFISQRLLKRGQLETQEVWAVIADVGRGGLKVLAQLDRDQVLLGLQGALGGSLFLPVVARFLFSFSVLAMLLFAFFTGAFPMQKIRNAWDSFRQTEGGLRLEKVFSKLRSVLLGGLAAQPKNADAESATEVEAPRLARLTAIHGTLRRVESWLQERGAEDTVDAINEFLTVTAHRVRQYGGTFERQGGVSFSAYFGLENTECTEAWRALRCVLDLRVDFSSVNAGRKVDGLPPLVVTLGVHSGLALVGRIGPATERSKAAAGEVLSYTRALDLQASTSGQDILVSQSLWSESEGRFRGEVLAEVRLTPQTGIQAVYALNGYQNERGEWVTVQSPQTEPDHTVETQWLDHSQEKRWNVNNGTQIQGPFTAAQIAALLFVQELDFDSECFDERTGKRATIATSAVFSGSEDAGALLWVYDGKTIHGPVSSGFLNTALRHGALTEDAWVCEGSTLMGWRKLSEYATTPVIPSAQAA